MTLVSGSLFAQKGKSLQANALYGSKIETVGFGLTFNFTGKKHEWSPSINVYLPKDGINGKEFNLDYHRLYSIKDKIKVFPIIGLSINSWEGSNEYNQTKIGLNLGFGGRYTINEQFDAGFQFKYSMMSESGSQSVPMLTIAYKL